RLQAQRDHRLQRPGRRHPDRRLGNGPVLSERRRYHYRPAQWRSDNHRMMTKDGRWHEMQKLLAPFTLSPSIARVSTAFRSRSPDGSSANVSAGWFGGGAAVPEWTRRAGDEPECCRRRRPLHLVGRPQDPHRRAKGGGRRRDAADTRFLTGKNIIDVPADAE